MGLRSFLATLSRAETLSLRSFLLVLLELIDEGGDGPRAGAARRKGGFRQFVSMVVDFKNRRLFELVEGRTVGEMEAALSYIPGPENVRHVVIDMCDPYRSDSVNTVLNTNWDAPRRFVAVTIALVAAVKEAVQVPGVRIRSE